jgi:hypothetical protein
MPVDETARLRPNDWSSLEVRLVDLSAEGFRAECEATMLRGSTIRIELPGIGEVEAQLTWRRGGEIGARFMAPIDLSRCTVSGVSGGAVLARLPLRAGAGVAVADPRRAADAPDRRLSVRFVPVLNPPLTVRS